MILVKTLIVDVIILICLLIFLVKMKNLPHSAMLKEEKRRKRVMKEVNKLYGENSEEAKKTIKSLKKIYAERDKRYYDPLKRGEY